jgi:hypothetical protein
MQNGKGERLFQEAGGEYFYESGNKIWISVSRFAAFRPSKPKPDLLGAAAREPTA